MRKSRKVGSILTAVALALIAGLAFGIVGAFGASGSPAPASGKVILRIGWVGDPDNLNPFIGTENSSYEVWALNYDFLFGFGLNDEPIPDLATEIPTKENGGISADGLILTVHLRPNVMWQDNTPLTADDVAWTINYCIKNNMYAYSFAVAGIKEVQVVDPTTIKIVCSRPKADVLRMWLPILPKHIWENVNPHDAENSYRNKPPIIGSGPFQIVEFKKGGNVTLDRNPTYWGPKPAVDEIIFMDYQNPDTMTADLRTGVIDAAQGVPAAQFPLVQKTSGLTAISYNYLNWDYLCLNSYTGGKSLGNPVLTDPAFRKALNYAINQPELVGIAFNGHAAVGTTILPPDTWTNPDFHWQPPAGVMYTFDLAKAGQMLDAAGYKDSNGDGVREDKSGKPIVLRLVARTESPSSQAEGKLIVGWFTQLGLKIKYEIVDNGVLESRVWNYQGNAFVPDFDMYLWDWDGFSDPGQTLACFTTGQIEGWNEPAWSNAQYDKLNTQQQSELDPQKRADIIYKMQQVMYDQSPQLTLTYPQYLQAYNTKDWTGWTRILGGHGPAIYCAGNIATYLNLKPTSATKSGASINWIIVVALVLLCVVVPLVIWMVMRRRGRVEEM